jgi:quaternary ammonium compound-resistance protein SugE
VELLFITLGGVILGLAARYTLPNRELHGSMLVPAIGGSVAAVLWVGFTWLGLAWDGGLIWLFTLLLTAGVVLVVDAVLGRARARKDDVLLDELLSGRVAPTV